jgi:hypothetical protein
MPHLHRRPGAAGPGPRRHPGECAPRGEVADRRGAFDVEAMCAAAPTSGAAIAAGAGRAASTPAPRRGGGRRQPQLQVWRAAPISLLVRRRTDRTRDRRGKRGRLDPGEPVARHWPRSPPNGAARR